MSAIKVPTSFLATDHFKFQVLFVQFLDGLKVSWILGKQGPLLKDL